MGKVNNEMDIAKGIGIVLVVVGHIIQMMINPKNYDQNDIFRVIYSFHMPLFMFVSGSLVYNPMRICDRKWLWKKIKNLVVPFWTWIPITYILAKQYLWISFKKMILNIIKSPDNGLWFLWVLFSLHFFMYLLLKMINIIIKKNGAGKIIQLILEIGGYIFISCVLYFLVKCNFTMLGIVSSAWYFSFYFWGYICNKYKILDILIKSRKRIVVVIAFLIAVNFWQRIEPNFINQKWLEEIIKDNNLIFMFNYMFKYIVPILGISSVFVLCTYLPRKCAAILKYIGKYTLEIYIIHMFLIRGYIVNSMFLSACVSLVVCIIVPIFVSKVAKRLKISGILFGK